MLAIPRVEFPGTKGYRATLSRVWLQAGTSEEETCATESSSALPTRCTDNSCLHF